MKYLYYLLIFFNFLATIKKTENKQEKELEGNTNLLRAEIFYPNEIFDVIKISSIGDFCYCKCKSGYFDPYLWR